ncbi:SDR family oxidoreductase [Marinibactrum halimedae]|uniref:Oxidoreductase n=1 Tax=Marinibactrum halimedae TaxID=1444977 RepID=A0AA37T8L5_9GAMM|nr:SDR family oxidoreductase [Marinibactrum halimedae]MCD9459838.1 SDR family oxidoreductase [Marinibactrum halimedae]GLS26968.1 oxidoreductase [Marinibactrum halimedae]
MKTVLITGCNGGIGSCIASHFTGNGYYVIGVDIQGAAKYELGSYLQVDLAQLVDDESQAENFSSELKELIKKKGLVLSALINNAAVQILGSLESLNIDDFMLTQKVNVAAPLLLIKLLSEELKDNNGIVLNVGSIHAALTKPEFISYAASKSGLRGLTQALAVDLQGEIRVNCIEPAAVGTEMLVEGFKGKGDKLAELKACHPSQMIAEPSEIAELSFFLVDSSIRFINGSCIGINGAISSRLHDPV